MAETMVYLGLDVHSLPLHEVESATLTDETGRVEETSVTDATLYIFNFTGQVELRLVGFKPATVRVDLPTDECPRAAPEIELVLEDE